MKILITLFNVQLNKRNWGLFAAVLAGSFMMLSCQEKQVLVQTETVFQGEIFQTVTGYGKIDPLTKRDISARVRGKIQRITVEEGDSVRAGQPLVYLEKEAYQAALERAASQKIEAQANLTFIRNDLERSRKLFEKKLISTVEREIALAKYNKALSQLQQARADVKVAENDLEQTVLISPISGLVVEKKKQEGEMARGAQFQEDIILVIANFSEMEARIEINENKIVDIEIGDTAMVEIDALPDTLFKGILSGMGNSAKVKKKGTMEEATNFEVRVRLLEKTADFRPGMSATVHIITDVRSDVLNVAIQSITLREPKILNNKEKIDPEKSKNSSGDLKKRIFEEKYHNPRDPLSEVVFLVKDGKAVMHSVKLGIHNDEYYEVLEGLRAGDEVVCGPYKLLNKDLKDGDKIRVFNRRKRRKR